MKWFQLANMLIPVIGAFVPGFAPFIPMVQGGVMEAQALHGDSNSDAKKDHVLNIVKDAAAAAQVSGKVTLDPSAAVAVTKAVFSAIDGVKSVVDANAHHVPVAAPPAA